jgi:hypothetical protein
MGSTKKTEYTNENEEKIRNSKLKAIFAGNPIGVLHAYATDVIGNKEMLKYSVHLGRVDYSDRNYPFAVLHLIGKGKEHKFWLDRYSGKLEHEVVKVWKGDAVFQSAVKVEGEKDLHEERKDFLDEYRADEQYFNLKLLQAEEKSMKSNIPKEKKD